MITELSNRVTALELAVNSNEAPGQVVARATAYLAFLDGPTEGSDAPKATRTRKAATASGVAPTGEAHAPVASPVNTQQVAAGTAQAVEQPKDAVTTPAKKLTIDDIRQALVALQTRKGSKEVPQKILESFSPTKVTGGVKEEDYAKLIAACAAA